MNTMGRRLGLPGAALALALGLSGCAGIGAGSFGPGLGVGLSLGTAPRLGLAVPTCLAYGAPSARSAAMTNSAAALAGERMQQIAALEARYRSGIETTQMKLARYKRIVASGC